MERFGRRTPLIIGGLWQSAWLFVYAIAGTVRDPLTDQGIGKREFFRFETFRALSTFRSVLISILLWQS
jgi:hypothetical protein